MKKKIIFLLMLMPIFVSADITNGVGTINVSTCSADGGYKLVDSSNITCDANVKTGKKFETSKEIEVVNNDVCTIKCTEEILFVVDPIKKVLAGTGFNYPLYATGERKCTAEYNYKDYEEDIRNLVSKYESETNAVLKNQFTAQLANLYDQKKTCDEFTVEGSEKENRYSYNGDVKLSVTTSTGVDNLTYVFEEIDEYESSVIKNEVYYKNACKYDEGTKTCVNTDKTLQGWTETAKIFGKYTMKDTYLELYAGDIKPSYSTTTCNAGDKYFTDFNEITKPTIDWSKENITNESLDKGYSLKLTADNLSGLGTSLNWKLSVDCWYAVNNLMFPQGNSNTSIDKNYDKYGGTAFQYRIIDVYNPFPGRDPGANWVGYESVISSNRDKLSSLQKFVITLNRSSINKIREYNEDKNYIYDTFELEEMEKSSFIEANPSIVDRK